MVFFLFKYISEQIVSTLHLYMVSKSHYNKIYCKHRQQIKIIQSQNKHDIGNIIIKRISVLILKLLIISVKIKITLLKSMF